MDDAFCVVLFSSSLSVMQKRDEYMWFSHQYYSLRSYKDDWKWVISRLRDTFATPEEFALDVQDKQWIWERFSFPHFDSIIYHLFHSVEPVLYPGIVLRIAKGVIETEKPVCRDFNSTFPEESMYYPFVFQEMKHISRNQLLIFGTVYHQNATFRLSDPVDHNFMYTASLVYAILYSQYLFHKDRVRLVKSFFRDCVPSFDMNVVRYVVIPFTEPDFS
jgi:hypothetical protein